MNILRLNCLLLVFMLALNGCATNNQLTPGKLNDNYIKNDAFADAITEEDILQVREDIKKQNNSPQLRNILSRIEDSYIFNQTFRAQEAFKDDDIATAEAIYQKLNELFPTNQIGLNGLTKIANRKESHRELGIAQSYLEQKNYNDARITARNLLFENPGFSPAAVLLQLIEKQEQDDTLTQSKVELGEEFKTKVDLNFRRASIDIILQSLSSSLGINIVIDQGVDNTKETSIFLKDTPLIEALTIFSEANNLYVRPINENTVMVLNASAPQNKKENSPSIASFQVVHADVNEMAALLSSIVNIQDVYIDEKLNIIVISSTPEKIQLAQRLIALKDIPEPMVMLELEILEVSRRVEIEKGLKPPNNFTISPSNSGGVISIEALKNLNSSRLELSPIPNLRLQLSDETSTTKLLANPRMKILNNETGNINIGDRLPLVSSETNDGVTSEKISFINVGIVLSFTPQILSNGEIILDVNLEVSSLNETITTPSSTAYRIGTRSFRTKLRTRNGETQILGGLLRDEDRSSYTGFPVFLTNESGDRQQTEIILSITPRLFDYFKFSKKENDALFQDINPTNLTQPSNEATTPSEQLEQFSDLEANENIPTSTTNTTTNESKDLSNGVVTFNLDGQEQWDGFSPLAVTLYSDSNIANIVGGAVIEFKRKKLFSGIEVVPIDKTNIIHQEVNMEKGTVQIIVDNIPSGQHPLVVLQAKPKFRVLEKVLFKLDNSLAETEDGQEITAKTGRLWAITPK